MRNFDLPDRVADMYDLPRINERPQPAAPIQDEAEQAPAQESAPTARPLEALALDIAAISGIRPENFGRGYRPEVPGTH